MINKGGRPTLFGSKRGGLRIQGNLTKLGGAAFRGHQRELARLLSRPVTAIGHADVIEYLALGKDRALKVLKLK